MKVNSLLVLLFLLFATVGTISCHESPPSIPMETGQVTLPVNGQVISVIPGPGSHLLSGNDEPSSAILMSIDLAVGVCDKDYTPLREPITRYKKGDPCLILTGSVLNTDKEYTDVIIWADGLDADGNKVAWTLDAYHLIGRTGLTVDYNQTGEFTIHLNPDADLSVIRLYSTIFEL